MAVVALAATGASGCADDGADEPTGEVLVVAPDVAALVALPDGGVRYGERRTGRILDVAPDGGEPQEVARVEVGAEGQRGLVGLAVDAAGRTFAAWTGPDGRLVVGQVAPGPVRLVWEGPASTDRATGGHVVVGPDGNLVIGVGDLLDPAAAADPATPNGKLLRLDPDGPPGQAPSVVSAGWNNPYAFAFAPGGALWVADNSPGDEPERLARGDVDRRPTSITDLPPGTAPSGLAAPADDDLLVCGYVSGTLTRWAVDADGSAEPVATLASDCRIGAVVLADGRVAYSTEDAIAVVAGDQ